MERYPRLTRAALIARLRAHAEEQGFVSHASLHQHDPVAYRSVALHFVGLGAARRAAAVPGAPYRHTGAKRGPKAGWKPPPRVRRWSRARVLAELRRLDRSGRSTRLDDLLAAGLAALVSAVTSHVGSLRKARSQAGIDQPAHRGSKRNTWNRRRVVDAIKRRRKTGALLAMSAVPQDLYRAARAYFGSWADALVAVGIDSRRVRAVRKYTRDGLIARLRRAARDGSDLRDVSLKKVLDLKALRREFGTIAKAVTAAGLDKHLVDRKHGGQKWTRELVLDSLRERATRGEYRMTPGLYRAAQLYCGGTEEARAAAGVPTPSDIAREERRRGRGTEDRRAQRRFRRRRR